MESDSEPAPAEQKLSRQERRHLERQAAKAPRAAPLLTPEVVSQASSALGQVRNGDASALGGLLASLAPTVGQIASSTPDASASQTLDLMLSQLGGVSGKSKVKVSELEKVCAGLIDPKTIAEIRAATGHRAVVSVKEFKQAMKKVLLGE